VYVNSAEAQSIYPEGFSGPAQDSMIQKDKESFKVLSYLIMIVASFFFPPSVHDIFKPEHYPYPSTTVGAKFERTWDQAQLFASYLI
jgi:hypothetical protein